MNRVAGVLIDDREAAFLIGALDLLTRLLADQRDGHGHRTPSQPSQRLAAVTAKLRRVAAVGSQTEETTSARVTPHTDVEQHAAHEVTPAVAARILGCTTRNARDLAARGRIPARRVGGRWVLDAAAVDHYGERRAAGRAG